MKPSPRLAALIDLALTEDLGAGDLTSEALFSEEASGKAKFVAREELIASGLSVAASVFRRLDDRCLLRATVREGGRVRKDGVLAVVTGPLRALLTGERTALNFVRHLSGVATLTRRYVQALRGTDCRLLDTRKTTPGMRTLEKAAVRAGGGSNHRLGLFDAVLIKDNHVVAVGSIVGAVEAVRRRVGPLVKIEVEATSLAQVREALKAGVDVIMLDNLPPRLVGKAVLLVAGRARTEASGRLNLENVRLFAECGVDFISVGALTHSAPAVDISMELMRS